MVTNGLFTPNNHIVLSGSDLRSSADIEVAALMMLLLLHKLEDMVGLRCMCV